MAYATGQAGIQGPGRSVQSLPVNDVTRALGSTPQGLTRAEASERLLRHGPNTIQEVSRSPLALRFLGNFTHLMAVLLWAGGAAAFAARMPQLGVAVWLVNVINGAFSFWQEFRAEKATEALRRMLPQQARVLRDGREASVPAEELVPGDVLVLSEGDRISADGRLVEEAGLRVDQSTLTGEAHPARKSSDAILTGGRPAAETPNLVFAGTNVVLGTGKAVVFATGMSTEFGKIARLTQSLGEERSPLQREMIHVTKVVTAIAVGFGLAFFLLAVVLVGIDLSEGFLFSIGMIVAFVPEGLLPTVTLALAMGVQRMARRNALVKKLSAVETLGCTTVICTDKTGTLTENEMTVRELWLPQRTFDVTGGGYAAEGAILEADVPVALPAKGDLRHLLVAAALCTNARLLRSDTEPARWTVLGDPTEAALVVAATKAGLDLAEESRRAPRVREIPFESSRKRMTTVHRMPDPEPRAGGPPRPRAGADARGALVAFVKGAPREMLALCTSVWREGRAEPMAAEVRRRVEEANDDCARRGLRVLAVARRELLPVGDGAARPPAAPSLEAGAVETDLTFLGLVAMMDPPRAEVSEAVRKCRRAGIRIIMVTGDYGLTAESIARRIGIVSGPPPRIVSGGELDTLEDARLRDALSGDVIFARAAPEQKLRIVQTLQGMGHVVAVTGDGVNDAPALRKADIGIAMGVAGTDVAKEAADVILADDNFASIVNAVEEGRAVYANISKFITYIFTSNAPEAVPFVLFALTRGRIPLALTVMQVLSIDLGTDLLPALALGVEPPEAGVMDRPPRDLRAHVITPALLRRAFLWLGAAQSLAAMAAFYFQFWMNGHWGQWLDLPASGPLYRSATAMALAAVVVTQVGNLFAQRTASASFLRGGLAPNRLLWASIVTELVVVALLIYAPLLQGIFGTSGFSAQNWLFLLALAPVVLVTDEVRKAFERRRERPARR